MIARRRLLGELTILAGLILVLTVLGPFGSYQAPFHRRLIAWALYLITGYCFFRPVIAAGDALVRQTHIPRPIAIFAACALAAFPTAMVIALGSAGPDWRSISVSALLATYLQTLIVGATVTVVQLLARAPKPEPGKQSRSEDAGESAPPVPRPIDPAPPGAATAPAFLDLLPPHLRGDVLCLENEDHYVRVHTVHGNAMILMRMRDAVAQLEGNGARVHRSWWVARDAVAGVIREDRNMRLRLVDGRIVPVARANVPMLREQGWLETAAAEAAS